MKRNNLGEYFIYLLPATLILFSTGMLMLTLIPDWWSMESDNVFMQSVILKFRTEYTSCVLGGIFGLLMSVILSIWIFKMHRDNDD
jgi:hypothetical protein